MSVRITLHIFLLGTTDAARQRHQAQCLQRDVPLARLKVLQMIICGCVSLRSATCLLGRKTRHGPSVMSFTRIVEKCGIYTCTSFDKHRGCFDEPIGKRKNCVDTLAMYLIMYSLISRTWR